MPRPPRQLIENGLYHVTSRGDRQEPIYEDDSDRLRFLAIVALGMRRCRAHAHAFCLMGNHYHLLVQTPDANLSKLMHFINGVYTQYSNRRHQRCGHVFQGRFHAELVDRDAYFLEVCRYIDLNPVRAGLVTDVAAWTWSSFRAHAGLEQGPGWLNSRLLHECLSPHAPRTEGPPAYSRFVEQGVSRMGDGFKPLLACDPGPGVKENHPPQALVRVQARLQSYREKGRSRNAAIYSAFADDGYSMAIIAEAMQLSLSRISRVIREQADISFPSE